MSKNGFYGMVFRPCSLTEEANEKLVMSSVYSVGSDFRKEYNNHIGAMQVVAECAKVFIIKNWQSVKDWSDLNVTIKTGKNKYDEYFNYKEPQPKVKKPEVPRTDGKRRVPAATYNSPILARFLKELDDEEKARHNPVTSFKNVDIDPSDGDFYVTINDNHYYLWDDEAIVVIADYIEKQIQKQTANV